MYFKLGALFLLGTLSVSSALPPCMCTRNLRPVCGSDGHTYSNKCMLQCAQVSNTKLFLQRNGRCDGSNLGPPRRVRQVEVDCFCTYEYNPFCGTDGLTYPNRCSIDCAKRSAPVDVAYQGECRQKRETVQVAQLPSRCSCPRNVAPVCGSDGNTYDNDCILDCASQNIPELRIQHVGECETEFPSCSCTREVIPVCGTDGNTYDNACFLKCAKKNNKDLDMLHDGECDNSVKVVDSPTCSCTREGRPVCGTDGNTYGNPCLLNCARNNDESLHIDYEGPCDNRVKVVEEAENFPCTCTRNFKPVCASNGVTFSNKCLMKCAGTHLTVAKEAPCEE